MRHRLVCLILAALLPLLLILPAAAQDDSSTPFVLCGELDDADCAILEESALAMLDNTSSAFTIQFDSSIGGFPDMPVDVIDFSLDLAGDWAIDDTAKDAFDSVRALSSQDPVAATQAVAAQMPLALIDLYSGLSFDGSLTWEVSQDVAVMISEDSDVPFPPTLTLNMRLVDGMMYIDLTELKPLAPELATIKADWIGFDMVGLLKRSLEEGQRNATPPDDALVTGAAAGAVAAQMMKWMQDYITVERLEDTAVDGQQAAVFQYTPDVLGFLASKTFRTEFVKLLAAADPSGTQDPELENTIGMLSFVAPMLFRDLTLDSTTTIGLDDYYSYATQFEFAWDLSGLMALAAMGEGSMAETPSSEIPPAITLHLDAAYSDYNEPMQFTAPKDVEIIPLDAMMPGDTSLVY